MPTRKSPTPVDSREAAFQWAWAHGWKLEIAGTNVTVRDGKNYVMTEMELGDFRPDALRVALDNAELQKSAIHMAVLLCGFSVKAARWWRAANRR